MKITFGTTVEYLLDLYPKATVFFQEHGIACFVCGEPAWGTLHELIEGKGLDPESVFEELLIFLEL